MGQRRDDFAWILELVRAKTRPPTRRRPGWEGYGSVDQILERRAQRNRMRRAVIQILMQVVILVVLILIITLL